MQLDTTEQARAYLTGTILKLYPTHAWEKDRLAGLMCEALHAVRTIHMLDAAPPVVTATMWMYEAVTFSKDGECITDPVMMVLSQDGEIA